MTTPRLSEFKFNMEKALRGSNHAADTKSQNKEVNEVHGE